MIVPMFKYSLLVFHQDFPLFLKDLQELGVLHIIKNENVKLEGLSEKLEQCKKLDQTINILEKREIEEGELIISGDPNKIVDDINEKLDLYDLIIQELTEQTKEYKQLEPWGNFSKEVIQELRSKGLQVRFYISNKKNYDQIKENYLTELIREEKNQVYFIILQPGYLRPNIEASEIKLPDHSLEEITRSIDNQKTKIENINRQIDEYASSSLRLLRNESRKIKSDISFEEASQQTRKELDEKVMILEGWVPRNKKEQIDQYLEESSVLHIERKPTPKEHAPVLLQNNKFSKLFEPIGDLFSLPSYSELDLTIFFAPFFMLFFGFCLGDAGYGLLFVIGAGLYKMKAPQLFKPYLSLIQWFGVATFIMGSISGTAFGVNLIESEISWVDGMKKYFLAPTGMFNLALIVGGAQIIFGQCIKAANQIRQHGFKYALNTLGWLFIMIGGLIYMGLINLSMASYSKTVIYVLLGIGGFFIIFFSDPDAGIGGRIGQGIWSIYTTVTGVFGDLLSYIRLFALGLSSAILGFVINEIGMEILSASKILGPIFFVVFLLVGHTLNILIASLGSFIHPARLTFVEFYKNAGFTGGGKAYKPFETIHHEKII